MAVQILIIDDDRALRTIFNKRLSNAGYIVSEAYNGEVGLEMAIEHLPDVIILDIEMPVMDGIDTLHNLRAMNQTRAIPVILVTATSSAHQIPGAQLADLILQKPVSTRELLKHVSSVLTGVRDK